MNKRLFLITSALTICFVVIVGLTACDKTSRLNATPPVATIVPYADTVNGTILADDYRWLRQRDDSTVLAYLEAENAYTDSTLKHTEAMQEQLFIEMKSRIKETDLSVPVKYMDYYYYSRTEEGKQYGTYCRRKGSMEAPEEIILDVNVLAEGKDYYQVGVFEVSPDQQLLAFSFDTTGGERYTLIVKTIATGEYFPDSIPNMLSAAWAADNTTMFYTTEDDMRRPYKLWRHRLGSDPAGDVMVYHEKDDRFFLGVSNTRSREYILMEMGSQVTSEVRYLRANNPTGKFKLFQSRQQGVEYRIAHHGDEFYVLTNEDAKNFKLMVTPVAKTARRNWKEVFPERRDVMIEGLDEFKDYLVIYERKDALRQIRIRNLADNSDRYIEFDEPVYTAYGGSNPNYDTPTLQFSYYSLITPRSVYDYTFATGERTLLKQREVLGGYDPSQYQAERLYATASDGTKIPISMVYKKGIKHDGSNPLYLYGYGSYGMTMDPWFSSNRLTLLDRGFIFAIAHIRGSGAMGRYWYEDGKLLKKKNTFTDFIAAGDYLVAEKYTSHDRMVISGGSAGGLLIGAVVNMRPDLPGIAVAEVPFVDVMNTMLDESIPLTVIEYDEWGNPNKKEYFDYMLSYSPYDNVEAKAYPNMLITAGLNDPRVQYWEPAKWTAKLRKLKTDSNVLVLKTNMGAGHGGASGRYDYIKEIAFEYAFIFDRFGIKM